LVQHSPEIGTPQIILAVAGAAADVDRLKTKRAEALQQARDIEGGMNGIAGARMVKGKGEQRIGRQAGAGAAKANARRGQLAQIAQRSAWSDRDRRHEAGYSAGTEASRSRIE
jgi:hypothetical protein